MNDLTFILLMRYFYLEKDLCTMNSPKHLSFSAKENSQSVYEVSLQLPYMLNSKMILARGTGTDINSWENHCFSLIIATGNRAEISKPQLKDLES